MHKRNIRIWKTETHQETRDLSTDSKTLTSRCAISANEIIESYYFDELVRNENSYVHLLSQCFLSILPTFPANNILQHYRAAAYHSRQAVYLSDISLPGSRIRREGPVSWPSLSQNITALNYFMCELLKDRYYQKFCPTSRKFRKMVTSVICTTAMNTLQQYGKCSRVPQWERARHWRPNG